MHPRLREVRKVRDRLLRKAAAGGPHSALVATVKAIMPENEDLTSAATELLAMRRRRDRVISDRIVGEAAWDILLAAFSSPNVIMQTKELCALSAAPEATTIRWLQVLERNGFLEKAVHPIRNDQRATYYRLSTHGKDIVQHALAAMLND